MLRKISIAAVVALGATLLLVACATPTPVVQTVEVTREVVVTQVVEMAPEVSAPFEELWAASAHAAKDTEPFTHWNEDSPPEIPVACAKCHSEPGYLDYIGADGSEANKTDKAAPIGTVVSCKTCHNDVTLKMTSVLFPSGVEVTGLGREARCMQCHQGRAWGGSVDAAIQNANLTDDDTVSADLGFTNIHYFAAGASLEGTVTQGGYQYPGKTYDAKTDHVPGYNTCVGCHDPHTLKLKVDECSACHQGLASQEDVKNIRMSGSLVDYDGDGDVNEGIYFELEGVREKLYQAIQAYASEVPKTPIAYDSAAYPYFFADTNANGTADADEAKFDNRYQAWTGRLAKAAYNYQVSLKDPGAFAHGGKYIIALLYDSIEDLNAKLSQPVDMKGMHRIDAGHFAGSERAFRYWDAAGMIPGTCSRCHSGMGAPTFLANTVNVAAAPTNGLVCGTCHDDLSTFTRYVVDQVRFPSGATLTFGKGAEANLCMVCHQGRESKVSVDSAIKTLQLREDESSDKLRFRNIHYFAAGATLFGTEAKGVYEYDGQTYLGRNNHVEGFNQCTSCHDVHGLTVNIQACSACHTNVKTKEDLKAIRISADDYDGDGNTAEGLAEEISTMKEALYAAILAHAKDRVKVGIIYNGNRHPYYFVDADNDGKADTDDKGNPVAYNAWTPRLLKAGYNYQYVSKDPGQFAHNGKYIIQVLYDSLRDIGGNVSGMKRP